MSKDTEKRTTMKRKANGSASARKAPAATIVAPSPHPPLTEEANLKATFSPGRTGGSCALPLGGRLIVPDGVCGKRDSVTCTVVPPNQRWRHNPSFSDEHLTSEIFVLSGHVSFKSKTLNLVLPFYQPEGKLLDLNVKGIWKDETEWVDVGFIRKEGEPVPCVELQIDRLGTFAVTFRTKTDQFQMTPNGGLFHSRINRNLSVRFPKKAVDTTINFTMQIQHVPAERVDFCRENFPLDCADLISASEFIDLGPDTQCSFRRNATVKLPLPEGVEVEGETSEEIVVLHRMKDVWEWVDSKYKFSRNTVTFDVKNPTRFCVVMSKPARHKKMQEAVTVLEQRMGREKGQITLFLSLQEKSWMALLECYPESWAHAKQQAREEAGFKAVHKVEVVAPIPSRTSFSRRAPPPPRDFRQKQMNGFELYDGMSWTMEINDDVKISSGAEVLENADLQYFKHLQESYRRFHFEPTVVQPEVEDREGGGEDGQGEGGGEGGGEGEMGDKQRGEKKVVEYKPIKGVLVLKPRGLKDPKLVEQLTFSYVIDIPAEIVRSYYYVPEPEPEPVPVKPKLKYDLPLLLASSDPKPLVVPPATPKVRTFSASALERLTQPSRRTAVIAEKEAKVISGKSLMTLSKVVSEGLTLAVHLDLPDSTITGIGFDALSNNRSMSDVGYRILLYWKRTRRDKRDGAVQHLLQGLRSMGKHGVADVVEARHQENKELTMDCFLMAAVAGVNIHS